MNEYALKKKKLRAENRDSVDYFKKSILTKRLWYDELHSYFACRHNSQEPFLKHTWLQISARLGMQSVELILK